MRTMIHNLAGYRINFSLTAGYPSLPSERMEYKNVVVYHRMSSGTTSTLLYRIT